MHLKELTLLNFKTYDQADLKLHPKVNCFVGNNGVGKTNLLDAIFYLSMCKSNFNSVDYQNIRHEQDFLVIQGVYSRHDKDENIYCAVKKDAGKTFKRNGKEYGRLADHIGFIPIVIISPADSGLILDGSEERRKYMNGVISQYNHPYLDQVLKYNKLLANRNRLLKEKSYGYASLKELFEVIDDQLDGLAKQIYNERLSFAQELTPIFQHYYQRVSSGSEEVRLDYQSHLTERSLKELLIDSLEKDRMIQYTTKGIHKDDLVLTLNGHPIKKEGSQGQQKTYLIALKLAQFHFIERISGIKPMLLLDDIFDKLDMTRVEQFIRLVSDHTFGQIFITDTNKARLDSILGQIDSGYHLFNVKDGGVELVATK
ncbi:DNA replication/repair protein RecF [Perlabentimonas gracilis]|uniref:DNA replication/repair protein RecF n=1 Tax=Perlabentimonas gracilis TaxID=2715279 RepID=UPI00140A29E3|nr:DNA replication and repair protein RecF [Perlabentimonas gracilis]NHB67737.1 DNA replication and repair protein RecF [Perlabentimonas gracilis]